MTEPELIHVGTTDVIAVRIYGGQRPEWLSSDSDSVNGSVNVRQSDAHHLMIEVTVGVVGEQHAVRVTIAGMYGTAEDVFDSSQEAQDEFARRQMAELLPFLRQAVYNASSQVWPVRPILLDVRSGSVKLGDRDQQE